MFKKINIIAIILVLAFALAFVGCGNKGDEPKTPTLSATELELTIGQSHTLTVNDYDGDIEWGTDDFNTVTVNDDGVITCLAVGSATITAYLDGLELTCKVVSKIDYVSVPKIVLEGELTENNLYSISLKLDGKHDKYEISPVLKLDAESVSGVSFTLTSADDGKVTIDGMNIVAKAKTNGTKVTVSCEYEGKTYTTIVNVVVKGV